MDTIFAVSSGRPPAAIAVVRISGPMALALAGKLVGRLPEPRVAALRPLRDAAGHLIDRVLVLVFPGPASATGEDLVEFHCHGGRAVIEAVERTIAAAVPNVRPAQPGEFTRRALANGRIDLAQAEGLADLLAAETEAQRRAALAAAEGVVSQRIRGWLDRLSGFAAEVEAILDFSDEEDVVSTVRDIAHVHGEVDGLAGEIRGVLAAPPVERLRDGVRVVIAGPPNSGKSTLLNRLAEREAAIVTPISGTTRDRIEVPVARDGMAYLLIDTAGLTESVDDVERIGVGLAEHAIVEADLLIWMGDDPPPREALWVHARADQADRHQMPPGRDLAIGLDRQTGVTRLWGMLAVRATGLLPASSQLALNRAQRDHCRVAVEVLDKPSKDPLLLAEALRVASGSLAAILGIHATEMMLDDLFGRFCVGK